MFVRSKASLFVIIYDLLFESLNVLQPPLHLYAPFRFVVERYVRHERNFSSSFVTQFRCMFVTNEITPISFNKTQLFIATKTINKKKEYAMCCCVVLETANLFNKINEYRVFL